MVFFSCENTSQYEKIFSKDQAISDKIQSLFDHSQIIVNKDTILVDKALKSFYEARSFKPLWFLDGELTDPAQDVQSLLIQTRKYGLPDHLYKMKHFQISKENYPELELMLTLSMTNFLEHHHFGLLNEKKTALKPYMFYVGFKETVQNIAEKGIGWEILSSQWGGKQVDHLLKQWSEYDFTEDINNLKLEMPVTFKEDSVKAYRVAFENLIKMGFITEADSTDSLKLDQLKNYQNLHALKSDGLIGKYGQQILVKNHQQRFEQLVLAVEKWKWKRDSLKGSYIYVNIPEYLLYYYLNDSLKALHKVIVGSRKNETPEFTAEMTTLVTYPFWHVPHSIASTEIVSLARNNMKRFYDKGYIVEDLSRNEISPDSLEWSKYNKNYFPYRVKQDKGHSNSLGILKFLFPNKHMVYIHDTPGKYLFINEVRAYSHGCIRLQNPVDFAKVLIEDQELKDFNADSLQARLDSSFQRVIELKKQKPVIIDYITTTVDPESDSLQFHIDIYGRDEKYIDVIFSKK